MTLWKQFQLPQELHSKGSGIMYYLRYSFDRVCAHRDQIAKELQSRGVYMEDFEHGIGVSIKPLVKNIRPIQHLLEELSALNEAVEYFEAFGRKMTLDELKSSIQLKTFDLLGRDLPEAYNFVDYHVPMLVSEIRAADRNDVLYGHERRTLQEITDFASNKVEQLNRPGGIILLKKID